MSNPHDGAINMAVIAHQQAREARHANHVWRDLRKSYDYTRPATKQAHYVHNIRLWSRWVRWSV